MRMQQIALFSLVATAIGGIAWVFLYPILSGERTAERRRQTVARSEPTTTRVSRGAQKTRREQVEESLKDLEVKNNKSKKPPLQTRIQQAGLSLTKQKFLMFSVAFGIAVFLTILTMTGGILPALALGFAAAFGLPMWALSFLKKRRENKFLNSFPDSVDVIVRGIKAGLPLLDSIKIIANEAGEPTKSEFKAIIETQTIGIPLGEACAKLYERMPLPEANFFGIVISIQQKAGGNLSEALGNLSRVLRDRKKMKAKIQAMSMEAKASAMIIGSLPICVGVLVYLTSPDYIELLWTTELGRVMIACCVAWMSVGVFVMKKMINFDF
jgi:tight adherence protein B